MIGRFKRKVLRASKVLGSAGLCSQAWTVKPSFDAHCISIVIAFLTRELNLACSLREQTSSKALIMVPNPHVGPFLTAASPWYNRRATSGQAEQAIRRKPILRHRVVFLRTSDTGTPFCTA